LRLMNSFTLSSFSAAAGKYTHSVKHSMFKKHSACRAGAGTKGVRIPTHCFAPYCEQLASCKYCRTIEALS
jgi:hypothetical protein